MATATAGSKARKSFLRGFLFGCLFILALTQLSGSRVPHDNVWLAANVPERASALHSKAKRRQNSSAVREHPHAGAQDENGAWNYVPDVQGVRRIILKRIHNDPDSTNPHHYLPLDSNSTVCHDAPGKGFEGPDGYRLLREYVELDGPDPLPEEQTPVNEAWHSTLEGNLLRHQSVPSTNHRTEYPPPRILCGIYTHEASHGIVRDIAETWGWRCDGFFAASNKTDRTIGAVDLPHQGPEEYDNMWQKTRSMVAFMYDNYLQDYDYFLLGGDDTFMIMENLRNYLLLLESETDGRDAHPLWIGSPLYRFDVIYNTGGPSYILNRFALRRLVEEGLPYYFTNTTMAGEDCAMGAIMAVLHIHLVDTSDAANRQRFFHYDLPVIGSDTHTWWHEALMYYRGRRTGRNLTSTQSVGFHMITSLKRFSAILYNACPMGTVLGDAQNSTLRRSRHLSSRGI
jgi:hypothetical protein